MPIFRKGKTVIHQGNENTASHETIKITHEVSPFKNNFLNVAVLLHNNSIATDLHVNSTDTHQYLFRVLSRIFCWGGSRSWKNFWATRSILKFVNAYLSTQIHLEGKIWQGSATSHAIKEHHIQNVICSAMIVILALKNQLFDNTSKVWRPIFQQSEVWNCEEIIFVQQLHVFYSDELKNAYYTNTNNFFFIFEV